MGLDDRLRRLRGRSVPGHPPDGDLKDRIGRMGIRGRAVTPARQGDEAALTRTLGGERIAQGLIQLRRVWPRPPGLQTALDRLPLPGVPAGLSCETLVALDTETTGLAGGSGTLVFNLGLARCRDGELEVTQWVLSRFAGESAMLCALTDYLKPGDALLSYNGRSFDLPLLATRQGMHRLGQGLGERIHLDLLHPIRHGFGRDWPDHRLQTAERVLLGEVREGDLPGSLAPWAWRRWLAAGDPGPLRRVVEHNARDLVSLFRLLPALYRELDASANALGIARLLLRCGRDAEALACLNRRRGELDSKGRHLLARLWVRAGQAYRAVPLWQALSCGGCEEAALCLAKHYEHRQWDGSLALRYVEALLRQRPEDPALLHRQARLRRRIGEGDA